MTPSLTSPVLVNDGSFVVDVSPIPSVSLSKSHMSKSHRKWRCNGECSPEKLIAMLVDEHEPLVQPYQSHAL